jgi:hypothetical protein
MKELIVDAKFYFDLELASEFYEMLEPGCGDYFNRTILNDLWSLRQLAGIHRLSHGLHGMNATNFPFTIYYRLQGEAVIVLAVLDQRQDPEKTRAQLRSR